MLFLCPVRYDVGGRPKVYDALLFGLDLGASNRRSPLADNGLNCASFDFVSSNILRLD